MQFGESTSAVYGSTLTRASVTPPHWTPLDVTLVIVNFTRHILYNTNLLLLMKVVRSYALQYESCCELSCNYCWSLLIRGSINGRKCSNGMPALLLTGFTFNDRFVSRRDFFHNLPEPSLSDEWQQVAGWFSSYAHLSNQFPDLTVLDSLFDWSSSSSGCSDQPLWSLISDWLVSSWKQFLTTGQMLDDGKTSGAVELLTSVLHALNCSLENGSTERMSTPDWLVDENGFPSYFLRENIHLDQVNVSSELCILIVHLTLRLSGITPAI